MADCLFCRIIAGEIPGNIVYSDDRLVAFKDINPQAPMHVLIVPRRHIASVNDLTPGDDGIVGEMVRRAAALAAEKRRRRSRISNGLQLQRRGRADSLSYTPARPWWTTAWLAAWLTHEQSTSPRIHEPRYFVKQPTRSIPCKSGRIEIVRQPAADARLRTASACPNPNSRISDPPGTRHSGPDEISTRSASSPSVPANNAWCGSYSATSLGRILPKARKAGSTRSG